jgi:hypothetical protein
MTLVALLRFWPELGSAEKMALAGKSFSRRLLSTFAFGAF